MAIKRPDIYEHNNPNDAFVDTDFVRGGTRTTANTVNDLYSLELKIDQLKVYATKVYVVDEGKYYILKDIENVNNSNGWVEEYVIVLNNINNFSATTISATTYLGLPLDIRVTGGTYNQSNGIATFINNTGDTFSVSGFSTGYTLTSDAIINVLGYTPLSAYTDVFVTGGTYNAGTATFTNNTGGTFTVIGFSSGGGEFSGGTVTGPTIFINGLSANTFSATTYLNLPIDIRITGGTYNQSNGIATFINNTGGTFSVSGFSTTTGTSTTFTGGTVNGPTIFTNGLSANTFSATTYLGLPIDVRVTGSSYSNNTFTFTNNTGGTFNVNFNILTGLSITNNLVVSGNTNLNGQITSNSLSGTTNRLVQVNSGGTFSANQEIISAYLTSGSTVANLLENPLNWDINGNYTGATITGTFQGQKHYNLNYFFEAVQDNLFIRLIRG